MGHVVRCLNLSKNLTNCNISFLIEDYGGIKKFLQEHRIKKIFTIKPNISLLVDLKETEKIIREEKIDVLIIDKYDLKQNYCKKIKKCVKVVVLSDLFNLDFPADLVINGFIGFKNGVQENKYGVQCLVGPKFQILNNDFRKKKRIKKNYDLLVTVGGFDEKNIIGKFLKVVSDFPKPIKTKVILGPATIKTKKINKLEKICKNNAIIKSQTSNMFSEINSSKFGLCSGGITTYEFASMKVPFAIICQVKHQMLTAKEWEKRNIAINLGLVNKKSETKIEELLDKIVNNEYSFVKSEKIVDGFGAIRVSRVIRKMLEKLN